MTLGRTPAGAIKIKTDGGLRAVECACCGGCECDYHSILANPSDPDFAARVLGTAPNSFTQATISATISVDYGGDQPYGGTETRTLAWNSQNTYWWPINITQNGGVFAGVLVKDNCLQVGVWEEFSLASFYTTQEMCFFEDINGNVFPAEPDDVCPITINGVNYRTTRRAFFGEAVTGSATITFS